ncbi:SWIM zinc finger family protein [Chryseolinea lacunae]|uniref:SWIM zinc finger family protein n=1 Tax=Chryseolinea lacunae TaxID=2801331 RepID=A0ABS1KWQ5_9BACT|nr:SWIM zinc finger family protein [Chryseolinea lacunae]MBL0743687.1 SWIM zinc finger family protein [Chryseolinea lacunae]
MNLSEQQVEALSPNSAAFVAGKKLSNKESWESFAKSDRSLWGAIKGSGKSPYLTQIDAVNIAYKCTCPSRQFPCKHAIALLLLHIQNGSMFAVAEEPEWVKEWVDKRASKVEQKPAEPKERTEEEEEQLSKSREKTQASRLSGVQAGVAELELWLCDLVRMGMLDLPNKPQSEFQKVAARMVDAKAPGLAGWVKAFSTLNYGQPDQWQPEALAISAKLFLLLRGLKNYDNLTPLWQQTLRNLSGWSQSTKELLANEEAEAVKDEWLAVGQEVLVTDDEITVQRNWLVGIRTQRTALILNFGTRFSALENNVLPGSVLEAELAFFPAILPERAVLKRQRRVTNQLPGKPVAFESWLAVQTHKVAALQKYPWANDLVVVLQQARMINNDGVWLVADALRHVFPVVKDLDLKKPVRWLSITGNEALDMALVIRDNHVIPLGVIKENTYYLL